MIDAIALFAAEGALATATTVDKGHGRLERRTIRVSSELVGYSDMPGLAQVAEVRTRVTVLKTGEVREHVRYLFTSLTAAQADPARLLELSRGHWRIENTLFHVKDDSFGEDRHVLQRRRSGLVLCGVAQHRDDVAAWRESTLARDGPDDRTQSIPGRAPAQLSHLCD